jgi:starch phosphorylase
MRYPGDEAHVARMSLIDESGERYVRMAHLAAAGSHTVNSVAALHSELLKQTAMRDFHELWPEKLQNVTRGVTPRRFLLLANPRLANLLTQTVGPDWPRDLEALKGLERLADNLGLHAEWRGVKRTANEALAARIQRECGVPVDVRSIFEVQVKRIYEHKRQHLNVLHVASLYSHLKHDPGAHDPGADVTPRTVIFSGKAAPRYFMAKLIIRLIHAVGEVVNRDLSVADRLKVVFLPDFNVKSGQRIYAAGDLSEQISTTGKEASGTGDLKFMMNGALAIGTLEGANVEIRDAVGHENFFLFGLTAEEVVRARAQGYRPREVYENNPHLRAALDLIGSGHFSHGDRELFRPLVDRLLS